MRIRKQAQQNHNDREESIPSKSDNLILSNNPVKQNKQRNANNIRNSNKPSNRIECGEYLLQQQYYYIITRNKCGRLGAEENSCAKRASCANIELHLLLRTSCHYRSHLYIVYENRAAWGRMFLTGTENRSFS